jgi:hypothetical protein
MRTGSQRPRISREEITRHLAAMGDVTTTLATASPADKSTLYGQLGLSLIYHPGAMRVDVTARPLSDMYVRKCPRGDLNTRPREISPDRGNHATKVTTARPARTGILPGVRYVCRNLACAGWGGRCAAFPASRAAAAGSALRGARQPGRALAGPGCHPC